MTDRLRHALELIASKVNPPHRPGANSISLESIGASGIDLRGSFLASAYLRGFDLSLSMLPTNLKFADLRGSKLPTLSPDSTYGALGRMVLAPESPMAWSGGHIFGVNSIAALADGRIVSGSDDHTVRVWQEESEGRWRQIGDPRNLLAPVLALTVTPDSRIIAARGQGFAVLSAQLIVDSLIRWDDQAHIVTLMGRETRITLRDPSALWRTVTINGRKLPADPRYHQYTFYKTKEGNVVPAYEFPDLVEWDVPDKPRTLILKHPD